MLGSMRTNTHLKLGSWLIAPCVALLAIALWVGEAVSQSGPGFSCVGKLTPTEATICGSSRLASLDRQLNGIFAAVRRRVTTSGWLRDEQRDALLSRSACGANVSCIANWYESRIAQLNSRLALYSNVPSDQPSAPKSVVCIRPVFEQEQQLRAAIDGSEVRTREISDAIIYLRSEFCRSTTRQMSSEGSVSLGDNCYQYWGNLDGERVYWGVCSE